LKQDQINDTRPLLDQVFVWSEKSQPSSLNKTVVKSHFPSLATLVEMLIWSTVATSRSTWR